MTYKLKRNTSNVQYPCHNPSSGIKRTTDLLQTATSRIYCNKPSTPFIKNTMALYSIQCPRTGCKWVTPKLPEADLLDIFRTHQSIHLSRDKLWLLQLPTPPTAYYIWDRLLTGNAVQGDVETAAAHLGIANTVVISALIESPIFKQEPYLMVPIITAQDRG